MAVKLKRPILVGGLGLTAGAWLWHSVSPSMSDIGGVAVWGAIALGSGVWWLKQLSAAPLQPVDLARTVISRSDVEQALSDLEIRIQQFETESNAAQLDADKTQRVASDLRSAVARIQSELERTQLDVVILGGKGVGKTTLATWLQQKLAESGDSAEAAPVQILDTEPLFGESSAEDIVSALAQGFGSDAGADSAQKNHADLVLFVTSGDLTDSEFQTLNQLVKAHHRVLLLFNQQDRYLPDERLQLVQHIQHRLHGMLQPAEILTMAIAPAPVKVRRHQADGTVEEAFEQPAPDAALLQSRLTQLVQQDREQLIFLTAMRQTRQLKGDIQAQLNALRRDRALPMIEEYQWIAAAAAFANPLPSLDLVATAAINAQLITDLGSLYKVKFSTDQAGAIAGSLAETMVKLGLVEVASQALSPLLKSHLLTYAAGGLMQGLSAAYLTHVAGISLIEWFEQYALETTQTAGQSLPFEGLTKTLQQVFQQHRRIDFLKALVQRGVAKLAPKAAELDAAQSV